MIHSGSHRKLKGGLGRGWCVCICGPTTQVSASVHFWADAQGWRDTEGEIGDERRRGTSSIYCCLLMIKQQWKKKKVFKVHRDLNKLESNQRAYLFEYIISKSRRVMFFTCWFLFIQSNNNIFFVILYLFNYLFFVLTYTFIYLFIHLFTVFLSLSFPPLHNICDSRLI